MHILLIKIAVWTLAIIELWLLLQVPAIGNAVFSFVVGGELPWSDKTLSLRQMVLLLTGCFVLAVGLIFRKEINQLFSRNDNHISHRAAVAWVAQPARMVETVPQSIPVQPARTIRRLPRLTLNLYVTHAGHFLQRLMHIVSRRGRTLLARLRVAAIWLCTMEVYAAYLLWRIISSRSAQLWRWSRPRMERLDRWISRTLHDYERTADILSFGSELATTVKGWFTRSRSTR